MGHERRQQDGWSRTRSERLVVLTAAMLILLLATQPAFVPRDLDRQAPFAWEMYSKSAPRDEFVVMFDGRSELLTVADIQPRALANVDYRRVMPAHICGSREAAIEVLVYTADTLIDTHRCAP